MNIRIFDKETDYKELYNWWGDWGLPQHHPDVLSENGLIISRNGINIASAFIYSTDSYICWLEHLTSNKKAWLLLSQKEKLDVLNKLGDAVFERAKEMGFKLAFTLATEEQDKYSKTLTEWKMKNLGDVVTKNMTQYFKILT